MKITVIDSTHSDTVFFKREQFRELASDFLSIPDISDSLYQNRFKEEKLIDQSLNKAIITYLPVTADSELIQRLQLVIAPDEESENDQLKNIFIDYVSSNIDSSVEKKMLWKVNKSFQVVTTKQFTGKPETTSTYKVIWNEDKDE